MEDGSENPGNDEGDHEYRGETPEEVVEVVEEEEDIETELAALQALLEEKEAEIARLSGELEGRNTRISELESQQASKEETSDESRDVSRPVSSHWFYRPLWGDKRIKAD